MAWLQWSMRKFSSESSATLRLGLGALTGMVVGFLPLPLDGIARGLLGWCSGVTVYLVMAWLLALEFDARRTRERALSLDPPNAWFLFVMLLAIAASILAVALLLIKGQELHGLLRLMYVILGLVTLALSWFLIHTLYAFHYAHRYYQSAVPERGLGFPADNAPDYFDFLYYAFVIGMTAQVADVQVRSREMRRVTLIHGILSFAFNMSLLALAINVLVSLA